MNAQKRMKVPFLRSIRGKMATSFTLVIVFIIIMVLGFVAIILVIGDSSRLGTTGYVNGVVSALRIQSYYYQDENGYSPERLQEMIEDISQQGFILMPSGTWINTDKARLVHGTEFFVIDKDKMVVASTTQTPGYVVGEAYKPRENSEYEGSNIDFLLDVEHSSEPVSFSLHNGAIEILVPLGRYSDEIDYPVWELSHIVGFTVEPAPRFSVVPFLQYLPFVLVVVFLIIVVVTPLGVIFGLIAGRGLTKRISNLAVASEQLAQGNFEAIPLDKSRDEIGQLNRQMRSMSQNLQSLMQSQQQLAAIEERNRLARELHDTVKQQNFATQMQIRAAQNLIATDPASASARLNEAENLLRSSQDELAVIIKQLRPAQLEDRGLADTLRQTIRSWCNQTQIPVQVNITGERRIPLEREQALLRVAQEALSNVARHSRANMVWFSLDYGPHELTMTIRDNGVGFGRKPRGGMGLQNMQERIESLGGWFGTSSAPGQGTQVMVRLPLDFTSSTGERT